MNCLHFHIRLDYIIFLLYNKNPSTVSHDFESYLVVEGYSKFNSCFKMFFILSNSQYGILINLILLSKQYCVFILSFICCSLNLSSANFLFFPEKSTGSKCCTPSYSTAILYLDK